MRFLCADWVSRMGEQHIQPDRSYRPNPADDGFIQVANVSASESFSAEKAWPRDGPSLPRPNSHVSRPPKAKARNDLTDGLFEHGSAVVFIKGCQS